MVHRPVYRQGRRRSASTRLCGRTPSSAAAARCKGRTPRGTGRRAAVGCSAGLGLSEFVPEHLHVVAVPIALEQLPRIILPFQPEKLDEPGVTGLYLLPRGPTVVGQEIPPL